MTLCRCDYNNLDTSLFHLALLQNAAGVSRVQSDKLVQYYNVNRSGNYSIVAGVARDPLALFDCSVIKEN